MKRVLVYVIMLSLIISCNFMEGLRDNIQSNFKTDRYKVLERYKFFFSEYQFLELSIGVTKKEVIGLGRKYQKSKECFELFSHGCEYSTSVQIGEYSGSLKILFEGDRVNFFRFEFDTKEARGKFLENFFSLYKEPYLEEKPLNSRSILGMNDFSMNSLLDCNDHEVANVLFCKIEDCSLIYISMPVLAKSLAPQKRDCEIFLVKPYIQFELGEKILKELEG